MCTADEPGRKNDYMSVIVGTLFLLLIVPSPAIAALLFIGGATPIVGYLLVTSFGNP